MQYSFKLFYSSGNGKPLFPGGGSKIMFVRGSTTKREEEVADAARTANPDEIDIDEEDDDEEEEEEEEDGKMFRWCHFLEICLYL